MKINILEVSKSYYPSIGGLQKYVKSKIKLYMEMGNKARVITLKEKGLASKTSDVVYLSSYTPYKIAPKLIKYLMYEYDLYSVNQIGYFISDFTILSAKRKKKPIILIPHFGFHTNKYKVLKEWYKKNISYKILTKVDRIICFTNFEKDVIKEFYNLNNDLFSIIPHYFNLNETNLSEEDNFLLYLGRYSENKKINLLIDTFLKNTNFNIQLKLTVSRSNFNKKTLARIDKDNRIELLNDISEGSKDELLRKCKGLIYPSSYEAFGISLFEASQFKKPILCSNLEVFNEILDKNGVVYFENSISGIENAIHEFLSYNASKRKIMGETNYKNLYRYNKSKIKLLYSELFQSIL